MGFRIPGNSVGQNQSERKNCFGMIEWSAVRISASRLLPNHAAVAGWKHRALSFVEEEGEKPMPKDRGAEQGDVVGPPECSLALGMVASETRLLVAVQQADWRRQSGGVAETFR